MQEKLQKQIGIAHDSAQHIALLESKLSKLKKSNPDKVSGKDLITSMSQFRDVYMQSYMSNANNTNSTIDSSIVVETIDKSYLERRLLPEQPITVEETLNLVENDLLSKKDDT